MNKESKDIDKLDSLARYRLGDFNAFSNVTVLNEAVIAGKIEYGNPSACVG